MSLNGNSSGEDIEFVQQVLSGNDDACMEFVNKYTEWVLFKIYELMKAHCHYTAKNKICSLLLLQRNIKGGDSLPKYESQCDDCMDSYIWFFEYIKTKLKSYKGINNCSLKTFVWSIINSHSMYIDWLRWKYGRVF